MESLRKNTRKSFGPTVNSPVTKHISRESEFHTMELHPSCAPIRTVWMFSRLACSTWAAGLPKFMPTIDRTRAFCKSIEKCKDGYCSIVGTR
jgi:hypothetical protein